jgi:hypothetical protein
MEWLVHDTNLSNSSRCTGTNSTTPLTMRTDFFAFVDCLVFCHLLLQIGFSFNKEIDCRSETWIDSL